MTGEGEKGRGGFPSGENAPACGARAFPAASLSPAGCEYWQEAGRSWRLEILICCPKTEGREELLSGLGRFPGLLTSQGRWQGEDCLSLLAEEHGETDLLLREIDRLLASGPGGEILGTRMVPCDDAEVREQNRGLPDLGLVLDAGTVFGSGRHPSTRLAAGAIADWLATRENDASDLTALDVGTGSGILALCCARAGVGRVLGIDVCPDALAVARRNIEANGLSGRIAVSGRTLAAITGRFDLVVANLTPAVLSRLLDDLVNRLEPGGTLIVSGFQGRQADVFAEHLVALGLTVARRHELDSWRALRLCFQTLFAAARR